MGASLAEWYRAHGRHDLPWRATRDRWAVLVAEVILQQTQVSRALTAWPAFMARFPTPAALGRASKADAIRAWGTLGYPRRAVRLWSAAEWIAADGWPENLGVLPGVGRYTAGAVAAQADDADVPAVDVNVRRVLERYVGMPLPPRGAERASVEIGHPLRGRQRLLALMDLGALVCRPRAPRCGECPLHGGCATRGALPHEGARRQPAYEGSFRQRRGQVLAALRENPRPAAALDAEALASLAADGLAVIRGPTASLP